MTNEAPTPDAVEALECAILEATDGYAKGAARAVADYLELEGFTITRQPAMTEAELEREAVKLSSSVRVGLDLTDEIMALAKKYRRV